MRYLRPVEDGDIEYLRTTRNRPEYRQWFRQNYDLSQSEQQAWWAKEKLNQNHHHFIVKHPEDVEVTQRGYCYLRVDPRHRSAEFGGFTFPESNLGLFALRELFSFGFKELNLNRIWSDVIRPNRALELYKRLGFQVEGTLRQAYYKRGEWKDSDVIGLLREEWDTPRNRRPRQHGKAAWRHSPKAKPESRCPGRWSLPAGERIQGLRQHLGLHSTGDASATD